MLFLALSNVQLIEHGLQVVNLLLVGIVHFLRNLPNAFQHFFLGFIDLVGKVVFFHPFILNCWSLLLLSVGMWFNIVGSSRFCLSSVNRSLLLGCCDIRGVGFGFRSFDLRSIVIRLLLIQCSLIQGVLLRVHHLTFSYDISIPDGNKTIVATLFAANLNKKN